LSSGVLGSLLTNSSKVAATAVNHILLEKTNSDSYRKRTAANTVALDSASQTYYMGAGWGSVRASGLIYILLGNLGLPGLLLFSGVIVLLFQPFFDRRRTGLNKGSDLFERSLFALMTALLASSIAGAEPVEPILWVLLAVATAGKEKGEQKIVPTTHILPLKNLAAQHLLEGEKTTQECVYKAY
jgi:hypothetical protein